MVLAMHQNALRARNGLVAWVIMLSIPALTEPSSRWTTWGSLGGLLGLLTLFGGFSLLATAILAVVMVRVGFHETLLRQFRDRVSRTRQALRAGVALVVLILILIPLVMPSLASGDRDLWAMSWQARSSSHVTT